MISADHDAPISDPSHCGMKKARSVDFGSLRARIERDDTVASQFSRRAARGSYKALNLYPSLKEPSSQDHHHHDSASIITSASWRRRSDIALDSLDSSSADGTSSDSASSSSINNIISLRIPATWTIGKLSVVILLVAFFVDFSVCQLQYLEAPDVYDALSAEVIRPAFRYQTGSSSSTSSSASTNNHGTAKLKPRASLGSAAISSVTESLAPILPFTGGLDLRREDYWATSGTWYDKLQSVATQIQDAFSSQQQQQQQQDDDDDEASRIGGGANTVTTPSQQPSAKRKPVAHLSTISAQHPFVTVDEIADLTLSDVSETFRYALEANQHGFNQAKYMNNLPPRVKQVIQQLIEAVEKSRGKDAQLSIADPNSFGQVDALLFCAAMRIFAEWRVVRQVPAGYKGFAVGMSLGHKDIVQNVAKVESTVHAFLDHRRDMLALEAQWEANGAAENCPIDGSKPRCLRSPTIREVMQYETDMDVNPASQLPRLKDKSGSMGLLWTRRQLQYQTLLLDNVQKVPGNYASTAAAVLAAYSQVYDRFHGWAVQKIFNYSFQSAPEAQEIFKHMNPHRLKEASLEARRASGSALPFAKDDSSPAAVAKDDGFASFVHHVGGEWDKLVSNVVHVFDKNHNAKAERNIGDSGSEPVDVAAMDEYIGQAMVKDAYERIPAYLHIVYPLLDDLALTFAKLNMDDPTRV